MLKSRERSISSQFHGTFSLVSGNRRANRHKGYLAGKCSGCDSEAFLIAKGGKDFPYFAWEDCIWHESGVTGLPEVFGQVAPLCCMSSVSSPLIWFSSFLHKLTHISTTCAQRHCLLHLRNLHLRVQSQKRESHSLHEGLRGNLSSM
jgi:hypothetical protein